MSRGIRSHCGGEFRRLAGGGDLDDAGGGFLPRAPLFQSDRPLESLEYISSALWGGGVLQIRKAWRDCWITREDFVRVKELGLNCVRLPFLHDSLDAPDGLFPRIDQAVAWARETGVYLILDLHGTPGRQSGQHHTGKSDEDQLFKNSKKVTECELVWKKLPLGMGTHLR